MVLRILLLAGLLAVSSCASAMTDSSAGHLAQPVGVDDPSVTTLPLAPPDPLQAEVLADGTVTHPEMERVLLAIVACVHDGGYSAELVDFVAGERWSFDVTGGKSSEATDRAEALFNDCSARLMSQVEPAYWTEHGPTQQEILRRHQETLSCLQERGYDVEGMTKVGHFLASVSIDEGFEALEDCQ